MPLQCIVTFENVIQYGAVPRNGEYPVTYRVVVRVDEVGVIRQPTHSKQDEHHYEHLSKLEM